MGDGLMENWTRDIMIELRADVRKLLIRTSILMIVCGLTLGMVIGLLAGA